MQLDAHSSFKNLIQAVLFNYVIRCTFFLLKLIPEGKVEPQD